MLYTECDNVKALPVKAECLNLETLVTLEYDSPDGIISITCCTGSCAETQRALLGRITHLQYTTLRVMVVFELSTEPFFAL